MVFPYSLDSVHFEINFLLGKKKKGKKKQNKTKQKTVMVRACITKFLR